MTEPREITVEGDGVPVAVLDHGGTGPDLVLLHGGGGSADGLRPLIPQLTGRFRVVTPELRGHGRSGDGPMELAGFLADLTAVAGSLGLDRFAVAGHSLGGMLAAHWASADARIVAGVSLDGHRSAETDPGHYRGMPTDRRDADLAALREMFDAQPAALALPLPPGVADALGPRTVVERDGDRYTRFGRADAEALRDLDWFRDGVPALAEVTVPFLVVLATEDPPGAPHRFAALMAAYRRGLREDLDAATRRNPLLRVQEIASASHGMVTQRPGEVVRLITDFLTTVEALDSTRL
ncbi:pimeloyl-ACP methyl ester carboxylesterase [Stackebrandtia albiflava]|uniref:Pimeloyl-ACP methyl ester carboxylesterase n=1 Tax=Stackebrandtia albiflava TaxID=406432 RepID=A0A562V3V4_9ACTN|nr:alpha/beta hydrolase [Stackebrandtia albiflava]TWJ12535.1 pimeloyl-ACP methyl ester carboxylesterase [Stackebrandtia albiflava]